jgi:O-antigen ligase
LWVSLIPAIFSLVELFLFFNYSYSIPQLYLVDYNTNSYNTGVTPVGFAGRAIDFNGLYVVGSSSINFGIFMSFLFGISLIAFSKYLKFHYFLLSLVFLFTALLSRSSSVLFSLFVTILFLVYLLRHKYKILIPFALILFFIYFTYKDDLYIFDDILSTLSSLMGNEQGDFDSWQLRLITFKSAIHSILNNFVYLLLGTGYGKQMAFALNSKDPLIESFFLESLLGLGLFGFLTFLFSFIFMLIQIIKRLSSNKMLLEFRLHILIFSIILIPLNAFSGNIFSNEYFATIYFLELGFLSVDL